MNPDTQAQPTADIPAKTASPARRVTSRTTASKATASKTAANKSPASKAAPAPVRQPAVQTGRSANPTKPVKPAKVVDMAPAVKPAKAAGADAARHQGSKQGKESKTAKPAKVKLIRDGFTMPETEFKLIDAVKQRAMGFKREVKKSEVLRAGLKALQGLSEPQLKALLDTLPIVKTGRPKKGH